MAIDYAAILADMKAKRATLDASIAGLESALLLGVLGQPGESTSETAGYSQGGAGASVELPLGAFSNKTVPAAIKLYLSAVKRKQTNSEITSALQTGGMESTADNFLTTVTTALNRLKANGEVLRFKDGWGLAEHYNESLRARLSQNQKPNRKAKKKAKAKTKANPKTIALSPSKTATVEGDRPQMAIQKYVGSLAGHRITTEQVAEALSMRKQTVALILSKIAHAGGIDKNTDGSFDVGKVEGPRVVN